MTHNDAKVAFFIAHKTIRRGSKSVVLLLIGVLSLVFFNLLFIRGFLAGFSNGVLISMIDTSTGHIVILPQEEPVKRGFIINQQELRNEIETIPGIVGTTRRYILGGAITFDKNKNGQSQFVSAPILGANQIEDKKLMTIKNNMAAGEFPDVLRDDDIVLGSNLAGGYEAVQSADLGGATVGDKVQIFYSNGYNKIYTVRGVFHVVIGFAGNNAYISDKEAERVLSTYNQASEIIVRVDLDRHPVGYYVQKIKTIAPNLRIEPYTSRLAAIGVLIDSFNVIAVIIGLISILVAGATIFIMIYINALSKKKQIGIIKAVGIKAEIVELSYVFQALFFSVLAVIFGTLIFYGLAKPYLTANPIQMPYGPALLVISIEQVITSAVSMIVIAGIAGFASSRLISKKQIVETIWG